MKKIIHFSDIHIGYEDMQERFEEVIHNLSLVKTPAKNYVVVITGDIVDKASENNYEQAKDCVELLKKIGYTVLIVPGNHDYGTGSRANKKWVPKFKTAFIKPNHCCPKQS